jgi:hypothetical protein
VVWLHPTTLGAVNMLAAGSVSGMLAAASVSGTLAAATDNEARLPAAPLHRPS